MLPINIIKTVTIPNKDFIMLRYALMFFIFSIIAGVLGFGGVSAATADIGRILFYVFIVLFLLSLLTGVVRGKSPKSLL